MFMRYMLTPFLKVLNARCFCREKSQLKLLTCNCMKLPASCWDNRENFVDEYTYGTSNNARVKRFTSAFVGQSAVRGSEDLPSVALWKRKVESGESGAR